jgi:hypothetical protein
MCYILKNNYSVVGLRGFRDFLCKLARTVVIKYYKLGSLWYRNLLRILVAGSLSVGRVGSF